MPDRPSSTRAVTIAVLLLAALAVVAPYAVRGIACGHDLEFHLHSWMEASQQWHQGVLYPRWAAGANYGSGEPRFLFYPPLSWMLGAALGSLLPWMFVPVAYVVCVVFAAGWAMHRMAREWFTEPDATLIALAYALNPYLLIDVYARSAFAELLAFVFLPLLVLWIVRDRPARRMLVPLALTVAALWLINIPAAIVASYSAVLVLAVITALRRSSRVFLYGAAGIALGLALPAFFLLPAAVERSWVQTGQLLSSGVTPEENFLFTRTGDPDHDSFLRTLSWIACAEIALTGLAAGLVLSRRRAPQRLAWSLVALLAVATLLMLPISSIIYRLAPDLRFLQFPWRWLTVVGLAFAVFVTVAPGRFRAKPAVCALLLACALIGLNHLFQGRCDPADQPYTISESYLTGYGYMGTDEYTPVTSDNYEIKPDFPEYRLRGLHGNPPPSNARVTHLHWTPYRKQLTVVSPEPVALVLRLMNYPAWRVRVNDQPAAADNDDPTGRMVIALPSGTSNIEVDFIRTRDRSIGDVISLLSALVLAAFWYLDRRQAPSGSTA